ncbi:hypothetical protein L3Y34_014208 [Caenorhabditis briggsae]|uniref:Uncharacterized protein n=1 Tax=Caenorhabditis briggsae TaxID=6238 RepID=A0AAE9DQZ4_CAEBR|nr:hypothetical protein L3Y34_014208 [Caenorhabditis briggsae]
MHPPTTNLQDDPPRQDAHAHHQRNDQLRHRSPARQDDLLHRNILRKIRHRKEEDQRHHPHRRDHARDNQHRALQSQREGNLQTNISPDETMDQAPAGATTSPDAVVTIPGTTQDVETRATMRDDTRRAGTDAIKETITAQAGVYSIL